MNNPIPIAGDFFWIGVNDTETDLFEALWPLPHGVSYNSYLINDEKVAVFDTVKKNFFEGYHEKIKKAIGAVRKIDYLVITHMEPDHSGSLRLLLERYPQMQIIGNAKTAEFLKCFYGIVDNVRIIKDNEVLSTGRHSIRFVVTPMVHWPETMMAYDETAKVLVSGDVFGGFGTLEGGIFDDEVDLAYFEEEIRRYFSNIIGKYSLMVQKALALLTPLDIRVVAPTHGPVFRKDPGYIISRYDRWSNFDTDCGAVIVYGSMYGNTRAMVDAVAEELAGNNIKEVKVHNLSESHLSFIINDVWKLKGLILASCTYNTRVFPLMDNFLRFLENETIKNHIIGILACHAWSGGALDALQDFAKKSGCAVIDPVVDVSCSPLESDIEKCRQLARNMAVSLTGEK